MANKYRIQQKTGTGVVTLWPETTASIVLEETNKLFMQAAERTKLSSVESGAQVNVIEGIKVGSTTYSGNTYITDKILQLPSYESGAQVNVIEGIVLGQSTTGIISGTKNFGLNVADGAEANKIDYIYYGGELITPQVTDGHAKSVVLSVDSTINENGNSPVKGSAIYAALAGKVDAVSGKGLSTNDYTTAEQTKLSGIATGAQVNVIESIKDVNGDPLTITSKSVTLSAAAVGAIPTTAKGAANGVAELDSNGKVPTSQLPSYVDDVVEATSNSGFPATGESGKIYVNTTDNKTYRWSGSQYTEISSSIALGETSSTAYAGDKGKALYDELNTSSIKADGTTAVSGGLRARVATLEAGLANMASDSTVSDLQTRVGTLETTVGNASSGLVKDVADNADAIGTAGTVSGYDWVSGTDYGTANDLSGNTGTGLKGDVARIDKLTTLLKDAVFEDSGTTLKNLVKDNTTNISTVTGYFTNGKANTAALADRATTADTLTTARNINVTVNSGKKSDNSDIVSAAGSASFNGSQAVTAAVTLADSGVTAGTYSSVTVNAKGIVIAASGTAGVASSLANARTISSTGDVSWSVSFDGSADATAAATLSNTGVTAGTYTAVTVDAKGRVTAGANDVEVGTIANGTPSSSLAVGGLYFQLIEAETSGN